MKVNPRRIMDFIMGSCAGFCFFYGHFLGTAIGSMMVITHIILVYRDKMLVAIDESIKEDEMEDKK
jgi:hypothetical protein